MLNYFYLLSPILPIKILKYFSILSFLYGRWNIRVTKTPPPQSLPQTSSAVRTSYLALAANTPPNNNNNTWDVCVLHVTPTKLHILGSRFQSFFLFFSFLFFIFSRVKKWESLCGLRLRTIINWPNLVIFFS
jgi:hypothetical protein